MTINISSDANSLYNLESLACLFSLMFMVCGIATLWRRSFHLNNIMKAQNTTLVKIATKISLNFNY